MSELLLLIGVRVKQALGTVLLVAVLFGCGESSRDAQGGGPGPGQAADSVSISGRLRLAPSGSPASPNFKFDAGVCYGVNGYDDIREGLQVVVRDAASVIVGTGALRRQTGADADYSACVLVWSISRVPQSDFYSIEVGRRGEIIYSYAELKRNDFVADATLGN